MKLALLSDGRAVWIDRAKATGAEVSLEISNPPPVYSVYLRGRKVNGAVLLDKGENVFTILYNGRVWKTEPLIFDGESRWIGTASVSEEEFAKMSLKVETLSEEVKKLKRQVEAHEKAIHGNDIF